MKNPFRSRSSQEQEVDDPSNGVPEGADRRDGGDDDRNGGVGSDGFDPFASKAPPPAHRRERPRPPADPDSLEDSSDTPPIGAATPPPVANSNPASPRGHRTPPVRRPAERPRLDHSVSDRPASDRPSIGRPATGRPSIDRPLTDRPRIEPPASPRPAPEARPSPERPSSERPSPERGGRAERPSPERGGRSERPSPERPSSERPSSERPERSSPERPSPERPSPERGGRAERPSPERPSPERGGRSERPSPERPSGERGGGAEVRRPERPSAEGGDGAEGELRLPAAGRGITIDHDAALDTDAADPIGDSDPDDLGDDRVDDELGDDDLGDDGGGRGPRSGLRLRRVRRAIAGGSTASTAESAGVRQSIRAQIGREARGEQRTAWAYLGVLSVVFVGLVFFGWVLSDERGRSDTSTDPVAAMTEGRPTRLVFRIDDDVIAIQGSVPDEETRQRLLDLAGEVYGSANVVDQIIVDPEFTLESGTERFVGAALIGDERPQQLQASISDAFGLADRGFEVGYVDEVLTPANVDVQLDGDRVLVTGQAPEDQGRDALIGLLGEIWGAENVDANALAAADVSWAGGTVRVGGSAVASDTRVEALRVQATERLDPSVVVDTASLVETDDQAAVADVQARIDALVEASPIQFAPDSPEIEAESDQVLVDVAAALNEVPDVGVEVVGHTDDVGDDQDNLVLSEDRAAAIVERMTELGVDPGRLSSRGVGSDEPLVPNDSDETRALNRRIEFVLTGTSTIGTDAGSTDTSETTEPG